MSAPDPRLAALRANDIANLRNRIAAARKSRMYGDQMMVDVPTHVAERLLDTLAAAEGQLLRLLHWTPEHTIEEWLADVQARLTAAEASLAECYRQTGADPDGNEDWRLARDAVAEVTAFRIEYDKLGKERDALAARLAALEGVLCCARTINRGMYQDERMTAALAAYDEAGGEGRGTV